MGILIPSQAIDPRLTDKSRIEHDVDFLAMEPGLRVLVSVALDTNVLVYDHDFDVAIALLLLGHDRVGLVFADVEEIVKARLAGGGERGVHFVGYHFVGPALHWEELTLFLINFLLRSKSKRGDLQCHCIQDKYNSKHEFRVRKLR